ncbi:AMP-binding protein [Leifsonia sp. AG29]|uniref:AMP-binding protein n=1 Tax=Leifsonia sp. AG29 TaxID=2598860 RepID=UPI0018EF2F58|nr:AMP-binding protein [Leifsonia sp. AG29]
MSRRIVVLDSSDGPAVLAALRAALTEGGPAVIPRAFAAPGAGSGWPTENDQVPQNVALIVETSGSTGVPKRVALSADALLASAAASAGALGGQGQWLLALPTHYIAGAQVLVRSLAAGTEPVSYGPGHFDAAEFARRCDDLTHDLRFVSLVPVQLARLVEASEAGDRAVQRALQRFDGVLIGGQALTPDLRERAEALGARVIATYGSSETAGGCVYDGVPIGTTEVAEVDGMLRIAGPSLAEGYLDDPERTAAAFVEADGLRWYLTGDLGTVDGGRVTVLGRADNVIISGGEKVLLDAVERSVRGIDGFGGAIVVGIPDDEWGTVPVVVVERAGTRADPARLDEGLDGVLEGDLATVRGRVAAELGRAAAPAAIVAVPRMPRLSSGKPDRVTVRAAAERIVSGEPSRSAGGAA